MLCGFLSVPNFAPYGAFYVFHRFRVESGQRSGTRGDSLEGKEGTTDFD